MKRKVIIKLKATVHGIGVEYRLEMLKNAEHVFIKGTALRVGSGVTQFQAEVLCENKDYEVTITT